MTQEIQAIQHNFEALANIAIKEADSYSFNLNQLPAVNNYNTDIREDRHFKSIFEALNKKKQNCLYWFELESEALAVELNHLLDIKREELKQKKRVVPASRTNKWSLNNMEFLVVYYDEQLISIKKISKNDGEELLKIIESTFNYLFFGVIYSVLLILVGKLSNDLFFYSFLGASTFIITKIISNLIYNYMLIQKSKKVKYHEKKIKQRIKTFKSMIKENR